MKVFSIEKYKKWRGNTGCDIPRWAKIIDGMTVEEIKRTSFGVTDDWLEEINMKKEDLKANDIVTLRNGDRLVYTVNGFKDLNRDINNTISGLSNLNNDLTRSTGDKQQDIIKVERPVEYKTVFEREEVQELTVDEISERLGYKVKVVGEDR